MGEQAGGAHGCGVHQWTLTLLINTCCPMQPTTLICHPARSSTSSTPSQPLTLLHQLLHRVQPRQDGGPVPQRLAHPAAQQAPTKRRLRAAGWLCKGAAASVQPARSDGLTGKVDAGQGCAPQQASHMHCNAVGQQCPTAPRRRTCVWSSTHIRLPFSPPLLLFWKISSCLQAVTWWVRGEARWDNTWVHPKWDSIKAWPGRTTPPLRMPAPTNLPAIQPPTAACWR